MWPTRLIFPRLVAVIILHYWYPVVLIIVIGCIDLYYNLYFTTTDCFLTPHLNNSICVCVSRCSTLTMATVNGWQRTAFDSSIQCLYTNPAKPFTADYLVIHCRTMACGLHRLCEWHTWLYCHYSWPRKSLKTDNGSLYLLSKPKFKTLVWNQTLIRAAKNRF